MKHLLWHLLAGTRGGEMRARILLSLKARPKNAHQLAKQLQVDYKTVQHHLAILLEHRLLHVEGKYGATYFIPDVIQTMWNDFGEIWERIGKIKIKQ